MKFSLLSILLLTFSIISCFSEEKNISPQFDLTENSLQKLIIDQDREIQNRIMQNPLRFLDLVDSLLGQPEELFYLADKNHPITRDQAPENTVKPSDYAIASTVKDREVSSLIIDQLKNMSLSAADEGIEILFASGYRPYDYQETIYNRYVNQMGQEEADRISARPGTSQHQLGTAVDFGSISDEYAETEAGMWLYEHAGEFGFSLSYPDGYEHITGYKWECWHYRYISVEGIELQKEFFGNVQQYLMEFWHYHKNDLKEVWRK